MSKLRKELNKLEPNNRAARVDPSLEKLMDLKKANKDVVSVGWANSAKSAQAQFDKYPERYEDWEVREDEDIDGDDIPDTVIYNKAGTAKIINGQTVRKSRHPFRQAIYTAYPTREDRKQANEQIKAGNTQPFKKQYNKLKVIHTKDGKTRVEYDVNKQRRETLSAYKLFSQVFFAPIWDAIKHVYDGMPTAEKLKGYGDTLRVL